MKLIVDVGVGMAVEETLREMGHDVRSVRDIGARMPDRKILELAAAEERVLVTMDKDFGDLAVREGAAHAGVLLVRLEEATGTRRRVSFVRSWMSTANESRITSPSTKAGACAYECEFTEALIARSDSRFWDPDHISRVCCCRKL